MRWDLGPQGLLVLLGIAVVFGAFAQVVFRHRASWWLGVVAAAAFVVVGLFVSEGLFGWATASELQPNIDGLSFDEVLLTFLVGIPVVLVVRVLARDRTQHRPAH